ncbi:syndecan-4 [Heptranchias perlo]|uniref:syndecan-4 n=1 Tax=Heptranchias perlo TaxID=212740 RepID=UPI00355A5CA0
MLKICALVTLFLVSMWDISSAKTQGKLDYEKNHLNDLEASGFPELSEHHPDSETEYEDGSGFASGDENDMDEDEEPIDDEDNEIEKPINEGDEDSTDDVEDHITNNEVQPNKNAPQQDNDVIDNRVAMASTNNSSVFESTEMLAAMIAGGTIGLLFAILLILLLVYRMRKKDEGSYDLSKKPIYKKAPTTEFYA